MLDRHYWSDYVSSNSEFMLDYFIYFSRTRKINDQSIFQQFTIDTLILKKNNIM